MGCKDRRDRKGRKDGRVGFVGEIGVSIPTRALYSERTGGIPHLSRANG